MSNDKLTMTVSMRVTEAQALALQAMFEDWNYLSGIGSSRMVSFYADGDGNFHPKCSVTTSVPVRVLDDELRKLAVVQDENGARQYDFDPIAWRISDDYEKYNDVGVKTNERTI